MTSIKLGPILGLESEYQYTVCFLSEFKMKNNDVLLIHSNPGKSKDSIVKCDSAIDLNGHYFYRFQFNAIEDISGYTIEYHLTYKGDKVLDARGCENWIFNVPGKRSLPKIGFCSCNGDSGGKTPSEIRDKMKVWYENPKRKYDLYNMWYEMRDNHEKDEFHLLLMGGDQIYADSIWEKVPFFEKHFKNKSYKAGKNSKVRMTVSKMLRHKSMTSQELIDFERELEDYYLNLYIESWSNENMSHMLASVPSVMMWDDHDIFDGWGSHKKNLQNTEIFKTVFKVAKKYFEIFQIRTAKNISLICSNPDVLSRRMKIKPGFKRSEDNYHYSMHVTFRNLELFVLDNRSFRSQYQIMSNDQYEDIVAALKSPMFPNKMPDEDYTLFEKEVQLLLDEIKFTKTIKSGLKSMITSFCDISDKKGKDFTALIEKIAIHIGLKLPIKNKTQMKKKLAKIKKLLIELYNGNLYKEKIISFLIPVPIAHLNYSSIIEGGLNAGEWALGLINRNQFIHSLNDDAVDHWDHKNHEAEQKKILDIIFNAGEAHNARYVNVISGDVHTAGAAFVHDSDTGNTVTQLISSSIVHAPPSPNAAKLLRLSSKSKSQIAGYKIKLATFGELSDNNIAVRNFCYLSKNGTGALQVKIKMEDFQKHYSRNLNKFKGSRLSFNKMK